MNQLITSFLEVLEVNSTILVDWEIFKNKKPSLLVYKKEKSSFFLEEKVYVSFECASVPLFYAGFLFLRELINSKNQSELKEIIRKLEFFKFQVEKSKQASLITLLKLESPKINDFIDNKDAIIDLVKEIIVDKILTGNLHFILQERGIELRKFISDFRNDFHEKHHLNHECFILLSKVFNMELNVFKEDQTESFGEKNRSSIKNLDGKNLEFFYFKNYDNAFVCLDNEVFDRIFVDLTVEYLKIEKNNISQISSAQNKSDYLINSNHENKSEQSKSKNKFESILFDIMKTKCDEEEAKQKKLSSNSELAPTSFESNRNSTTISNLLEKNKVLMQNSKNERGIQSHREERIKNYEIEKQEEMKDFLDEKNKLGAKEQTIDKENADNRRRTLGGENRQSINKNVKNSCGSKGFDEVLSKLRFSLNYLEGNTKLFENQIF